MKLYRNRNSNYIQIVKKETFFVIRNLNECLFLLIKGSFILTVEEGHSLHDG